MSSILDILFQRAPAAVASGLKGARLGREYQDAEQAKRREFDQRVQQDAMRVSLLQSAERRAQDQHPFTTRKLAAEASDEEARAAGTGSYAPKPPAPVVPSYGSHFQRLVNGKPHEFITRTRGDAPPEAYDLGEVYNKPTASAGDGIDQGLKFTEVARLRNEFQRHEAPYRLSRTAMAQMEDLAKDVTGASDINLLIAAAKVADPESVVREGEVAIQRTAASLADRIGTTVANITKGEILSPAQRERLLGAMRSRIGPLRTEYETRRKQYEKLTRGFGGDPFQTIGDDPDAPDLTEPAADLAALRGGKTKPVKQP